MRKIAALSLLFLLFVSPAWAGFGEGQAMFSAGDYKGAYDAWLPLAKEGDARAQYSLGVLYQQGLGVDKDFDQAAEWFDRAAQQGYAPAAAALRALEAQKAKPAVPPSAAARPGPAAPGHQLSEREQIEVLIHELVRQANLQLRVGHLNYDGVQVSEAGDGFDVAISGLAMYVDAGEHLEIGTVSGRVSRVGDRYYEIGFTLPSTLYGHEAGMPKPAEIRIGRQSNKIVWDRDLELVVDVDVIWNEFVLVDPDGREAGRIAEIALTSDLVDKGGLWSGPVSFVIRGIQASEPGAGSVSLGEFGLRTQVDGLDMVRYAALSRAVLQGEQQTPEQTMDTLKGLLAGVSLEVTLADLKIGEPGQDEMGLSSASYRIGLAGMNQKLAALEMAYKHGGLKGPPPVVPELAPRDAKIRFVLDRLPIEILLQTGVTAALEYMLFGEVGSEGDVLNQLRVSLSEAQTEFRIDDGRFEAPNLLLTVAGTLSADAQALWGVSGEVGLTVQGLDQLIKFYEAENPPSGAAGMPSFGEVLRSYGVLGQDGKTYIYNLQVNREGQFLINGKDSGPLMAAFLAG